MARQIWKYVPVKVALLDLKKGDLFQMDKDGGDDTNDPSNLYIASTDARPLTEDEKLEFPKSTGIIETGRYILDPEWTRKPGSGPQ